MPNVVAEAALSATNDTIHRYAAFEKNHHFYYAKTTKKLFTNKLDRAQLANDFDET